MNMPKRRIGLIAIATIAVLSVPFLFMWPKSSSGVTVRLVKVEREGGAVVARFDIKDNTSCHYVLRAVRLEIKDDTGWKKCSSSLSGFEDPPNNKVTRSNIYFTPQTPGSRLRLVADIQRARQGLGGFWDRLRLRLSTGQKIPLNPFDDTYVLFTKEATEVVTEEFLEP